MTTKGRVKASIDRLTNSALLSNLTVYEDFPMKRKLFLFGMIACIAPALLAQPRPVERTTLPATMHNPAPPTFEAKYEGGMYGYSQKETGTLKFDDENGRLIFFGKDQKEKFFVPYRSMLIISPQTQSVSTTTGTVISVIPLPGAGLASLMREKRRYLVISFDDPDVDGAKGVMSFKLDNKELLDAVIQTLGEKARMMQRGDAYYRPKSVKAES